MDTTLREIITRHLALQRGAYGVDVPRLDGEERAEYALYNAFAATDELHEAMQELKWKPWLTEGRGEWVDRDAYVGEIVDMFFFMMNLLLVAAEDRTPAEVAEEFAARYVAKAEVNLRRQLEGYDGTKDASGRALDEPVVVRETPAAHTTAIAQRHEEAQVAAAETAAARKRLEGDGSSDYR